MVLEEAKLQYETAITYDGYASDSSSNASSSSQLSSSQPLGGRLDEELAMAAAEEQVNDLIRTQAEHEALVRGEPGALVHWDSEQRANQQQLAKTLSGAFAIIKHIPRVNEGEPQEWADSQAGSNRDRLQARLDMYGLCERQVKGDGNCQFRALADQLYRTPHAHAELRRAAVDQLRLRPDCYGEYVPGDYGAYVRDMARDGTWGDHLTLQAIADVYGTEINVLTSYPEACVVQIEPRGGRRSERVLYLSFWAEVHYNSLYPIREPPRELPHDKLFGSRRLYRLFRHTPLLLQPVSA